MGSPRRPFRTIRRRCESILTRSKHTLASVQFSGRPAGRRMRSHIIVTPCVSVPMTRSRSANLGAALAEQGKVAEAEAHLRAAARDSAGSAAGAWSNLGVALARQGRTSEAIEHSSPGMIELQPTDGAARRHLGSALAMEGRAGEAIRAVRDGASAWIRPMHGRGTASAKHSTTAGKLEAAALEYEKAVQLNPSLAEARANLGNSLARLGRVGRGPRAPPAKRSASDLRIRRRATIWRSCCGGRGWSSSARQQLESGRPSGSRSRTPRAGC